MHQDSDLIYDVIQVGYGPVSEISAIMLARKGHSVAVFERWKERYPLPRAVCIDHEIYRVLSSIGLSEKLPGVSHPAPLYQWFNAEWKQLLSIDWSAESVSGGPEVHFVHQPTMEEMFDREVRLYPGIHVNLGCEVIEVEQTEDHVEATVRELDSGTVRKVKARYLIGADGANSKVRATIGASQEDRGFDADWLVVDVMPNEGVTLDVPGAAQYCNPSRPTTIVPAGIRDGRYYRRWEFMRMPGESRENLESEAAAWQLLEPWIRPDQARIIRHKVYTFRSLIAQKWRDRRIMIAGDAAHVMPPFMGQGMCAGLRDAWNLSWKLDLVLNGIADETLLDTYELERRPHASDIIDLSMYLGKVICVPDEKAAALRDQAFFEGTVAPPPPFPCLVDGLLDKETSGLLKHGAGLLGPHGTIRKDGMIGRFDELVHGGFNLIARSRDAYAGISGDCLKRFGRFGGEVVYLAEEGDRNEGAIFDVDEKFSAFMDENKMQAILVRPDFYLFGAATASSEIDGLIRRLEAALLFHGYRR